ncbi:MAG TPA: hypothetical protein PLS58_06655 [Bacteroidales bacterium]|nr:hypothetical protein [Bacteroidales bacterium]
MRITFLIIVFLHGLIHILGFVKGSGISEVKALKLPVSSLEGVIWLVAALLITVFGTLKSTNYRYAWLAGFIAVAVSQTLVIMFWEDARAGTLPNIMILLVSIASLGNFNFKKQVEAETANLLGKVKDTTTRVMVENDIKELPEPVKQWLHRTGAIGKPYIISGRVVQRAQMKMKPGQKRWIRASALQYSTIPVPGFIWTVNAEMNPLVYFMGRDKYFEGQGEMLIKLNSLFNVANEKGPRLTESTVQRYLGEMVWFPSLAPGKNITWEQVDDVTVRAEMNYKGVTAGGTFHFSKEGDFISYSAQRFMENSPDAQRFEWVLDVEEYGTFGGIKVPSRMTATWKLPDGDWTWLMLEIEDIKYNP